MRFKLFHSAHVARAHRAHVKAKARLAACYDDSGNALPNMGIEGLAAVAEEQRASHALFESYFGTGIIESPFQPITAVESRAYLSKGAH